MAMATFPLTIFATQRIFNDYGADDMRYGDICERRMKNEFCLTHISNVVDPWSMTRLHPFHNPQSRFAGAYPPQTGEKLSPLECAELLFAEMQTTSLPFALIGPQRFLINKMLEHFMRSSGQPFRDLSLDMAYKDKILNDKSDDSTRLIIADFLNADLDYQNGGLSEEKLPLLKKAIGETILPKFDSFTDRINGLGITVHDVHATKIDILRLTKSGNRWQARLRYQGQDHFGLDITDIRKPKFLQFQFFKIWFTLQRSDKFGFRPFLTNMEAIIDIEGGF